MQISVAESIIGQIRMNAEQTASPQELCICNSGRRRVTAAEMLRFLGYPKALSVAGGFQARKQLRAAQ
jgi:rhodanese-related sulfurtransferase